MWPLPSFFSLNKLCSRSFYLPELTGTGEPPVEERGRRRTEGEKKDSLAGSPPRRAAVLIKPCRSTSLPLKFIFKKVGAATSETRRNLEPDSDFFQMTPLVLPRKIKAASLNTNLAYIMEIYHQISIIQEQTWFQPSQRRNTLA